MKLGDPDESGRRKPIIENNSEFNLKADIIIKALGFDPEYLPNLFKDKNLKVSNGEQLRLILIQWKQIYRSICSRRYYKRSISSCLGY